jgi:hypothetical protein
MSFVIGCRGPWAYEQAHALSTQRDDLKGWRPFYGDVAPLREPSPPQSIAGAPTSPTPGIEIPSSSPQPRTPCSLPNHNQPKYGSIG